MFAQYHGNADVAKLLNEVDHSGENYQGRDSSKCQSRGVGQSVSSTRSPIGSRAGSRIGSLIGSQD